jgi:putative DNA primase/helicase
MRTQRTVTENPSKPETAQVVEFPNAEERARRLRVEVERLAKLSTTEWLYYVESGGYAEKYGVAKATLKTMIEAVVKESEKKAREDRGELQRREKEKSSAKRESERKQEREKQKEERREREEERREREARKEAERRERDKQKTFETVLKLPSGQHEAKLKALAKRIDVDVDVLRGEFAEFAKEGKSEFCGDITPWADPVATKALLAGVMKQLRRYIVVSDEQALAITLWIVFAWLHESIAVHSPLLVFKSAEPDSGKTTACGVLKFLTPRAYSAAEMSGPSLFRFVDRVHPTLIIDDADRLLQRKPELAHVVNIGWTRGTLIPRVGPYGDAVWFDPFCAKVIAGANLLLPKTTATRTITIKLLPKLPSERVEDFNHTDDERFFDLRRKLARWSIDNAEALKAANPVLPAGLNNRLAMNWRLQLAVADLAGGDWPKRARVAAIKLDDRKEESSEGIRLLAALRELFTNHGSQLTSAEIVKLLTANEESEWAAFRNHGPITKRQIAVLLDAYDIHPDYIHPHGRKTERGYDVKWFDDAFERYLNPPARNRATVRRARRKR